MASSSSKPRKSYDVFLSFRGPDVRNYFLGHLYTALDQAGIYTYIDNEELEKGEQISPALMKAIKDSQIAIIIFSKDYASSPWCLEELTKIMECKKQKDLIVLPVFYKVDPHEVRTPRESYKEAMAKHVVKLGKDSERVERWKEALFDAGSLSGWHFTNGYEAGLVQQIVEEISTQLDQTLLDVAKYPVGIDSRVQELKSILNLQSEDDVLMVGLWGQGGVGKTTLAKAIYNAIFREFQVSSFLERVRENFQNSNDLVPLQEKLLSELLLRDKLKVFSVSKGSRLIRERLWNKKVLIILDDVDNECQLDALAGDSEWFGKGSRILITTRNQHLVTSHWVDSHRIYKVEALQDGESLELFRRHASLTNQQIEKRSDIVDSVLHYARGLPLALQVLGSSLCGSGEKEWEETLKKLADSPNQKINGVLRVSYDGLEYNEKQIFLDIACFFKGERKEYITKVLSSCDFYTTIGLQDLIKRSLISEENGTLQMHDLLQLMGMDIVKEECRDDPEKRSKLWLHDDVLDVLSRNEGTNAIKAIVLKLPKPEKMHIGPHAFTNMRKLRLLILRNVDNTFQGPIHLPNGLRWFEWPHCASIPEFKDGPKELVGLDMRKSKIEVGPGQFKCLVNLKFINLSECQLLVSMPDLSCVPNLEELILGWCKNLEHAHKSIAYHGKLWRLDLSGCSKLRRFPEIPDKNKSLRKLFLGWTSIEELPASIGNLISLEFMSLGICKKLAILPSSIYKLQNLGSLYFHECSKLTKFPKVEDLSDPPTKTGFPKSWALDFNGCNLSEVEFLKNPSWFPCLRELSLGGNNFTNIPTCEKLYNLECLDVSNCQQLQEIPNIPGKMMRVRAANCKSLSRIPSNICEVGDVQFPSCHELVRNGYSVNDWFKPKKFHHPECQIILPGGEMPKWLFPNKDGYISFVASKDLYKKFLRVAWCVVLRAKEAKYFELLVEGDVNGRPVSENVAFEDLPNSDHVCLHHWEPKSLWRVDDFGANDLSHFHLSLSLKYLDGRVIVKNCGFRLLCKPLENELQDDKFLDPALLDEVGYEDSQTSSDEEISSETEDLQDSQMSTKEDSSSELVHKGLNIADFSIERHRYSQNYLDLRNIRPGGEMPEEFVPVEDNTISFLASQDLYDKFIGLALCVVFGVEDGKKEISFDIVPHVHGQRRNVLSGTLGSFDSDHMWIQYLEPDALWGVLGGAVDFDPFEERYLQFSLMVQVLGGTVKKLGYMLRCERLDDDLKVVLEENQLVNPASLFEESDSEEDTLPYPRHYYTKYLRKFHIFSKEIYMPRFRFLGGPEGSDSETD